MASGVTFWTDMLSNDVSRANVVQGLLFSTKRLRLLLDQLFLTYLNRPAEKDAEDFFGQVLQTNGVNAVRSLILGSDEYFQRQANTL